MTREEFRAKMLNEIQVAQSSVDLTMTPKERLRTFIHELFNSIGPDMAKYVLGAIVNILLFSMLQIASSNHDLNVAQQMNRGLM